MFAYIYIDIMTYHFFIIIILDVVLVFKYFLFNFSLTAIKPSKILKLFRVLLIPLLTILIIFRYSKM